MKEIEVPDIDLKAEVKKCDKDMNRMHYKGYGLIKNLFEEDKLEFFKLPNVQDINTVTPEMISDYVKTVFPHHEKSIAAILTTLRMFLKFLYLNEYTEKDLTISVPKQNKYYYPSVPSTWKSEEVRRMLEIIDRGNPTGKRDYAIL